MKHIILVLCLLLQSCGVVTEILRGVGVPISEAAVRKAEEIDAKAQSWLWEIIFGSVVLAGGGVAVEKRRRRKVREKLKAAQAATP